MAKGRAGKMEAAAGLEPAKPALQAGARVLRHKRRRGRSQERGELPGFINRARGTRLTVRDIIAARLGKPPTNRTTESARIRH